MVYPHAMSNHRTPFHSTVRCQKARRIAKIEANYTCARCHGFLPGKGELHVHHRRPVAIDGARKAKSLVRLPWLP
jgi:hypothetical protein